MRRPFTLYKENTKSGTFWYARFWDEESQKYKHSRSTGVLVEGKKERRFEAEEAARKLIPEVEAAKAATNAKTTQGTNAVQTNTKTIADTTLIEYLESFWKPDSQYANYKKFVEKKPLSLQYIENNHEDIRRHVAPYSGFSGVTVGTLTKPLLREWLIWLASRKAQYRKIDGTVIEKETISSRKANIVIQTVRVAIRWAFDNEKITADPFHKLGEVTDTPKEKGVLTFAERQKLNEILSKDSRLRLIMLLGSYCGLRRGEIRGLQWRDIENGLIDIKHNFTDKEGLKDPKWGSFRKVPIIPQIENLLNDVYTIAQDKSPEAYIFASPDRPNLPVSNNFFRDTLSKELTALGITKEQQKKRNLTCHSLRHTFVTLSQLSGMSNAEVMALAGQKREATLRKYSHVPQVLDFDEARRKILTGQEQTKKASNQ
jgi:integrase